MLFRPCRPSRVRAGRRAVPPRRNWQRLFKQVDELLNERLDALVVQFKDSQPAFFNAYTTAREVVNAPGGRASKDAVVTPVSKAA